MLLALLSALLSPAAQAAEVYAGSTDGFEAVTLDLGAYVQPRFTWSPQDDSVGYDGELGFAIKRSRLGFKASFVGTEDADAVDGWRGPSLLTAVAIELVPEARLYDAYGDLRLAHPLQLRVGQFKAPTTHNNLVSGSKLALPDSAGTTGMAPKREIGAMLHGFVGRHHLGWAAGVFNGEGTNRLSNVNRKMLWAGRVEVSPLGAPKDPVDLLRHDWRLRGGDAPLGAYNPDTTVTLAGHGYRNIQGSPGEQEGTWGIGADLFFHWRWVNLSGAWLTGATQWEDTAIADSTNNGWWGQLVLFTPAVPWAEEHLALISRVEQFDEFVPDPGTDVPLVNALDPAQEQRNITAGLLFLPYRPWFRKLHDAKLLVTYTVKQELEDLGYDNDELLVSSQLAF